MTPAQIEEIIQLRSRNVSPKQIARKLGLRPANVTKVIRQQSESGKIQKELPKLHAVLINEVAAQDLLNLADSGESSADPSDFHGGGLAQVILLRIDEKGHHWVSSYLVDYWCLGVKNTFGPRQMTRKQFDEFLWDIEERFGQSLQEISIEQAQAVVFGAIDYARGLGLEPHSDFRRSRSHLGPQPDPSSETDIKIQFGKDGMPHFIAGPYDDATNIMATLRETVGDGNFHYLVGLGPPPDEVF